MVLKRLIASSAAVCLAISACGAFAGAYSWDEETVYAEGDYEYIVLEDDTVEIKYYGGSGSSVSIPSKLGGKTVTSIGKYAFEDYKELLSVDIPDTVINIGYGAFNNSGIISSQKEGVIYADNWVIGYNSPSRSDSGDKNCVIKSGTVGIASHAFEWEGVNGYTDTVTIPSGVKYINDEAFHCSYFDEVTIPSTVKYIGKGAFESSDDLKTVTVSVGVTDIGEEAFQSCDSLTTVTLPKGLKTIGKSAFSHTDIESIEIPSTVTFIGSNAFFYTPLVENQRSKIKYAGNWVVDCERDAVSADIKDGTVGIASCAFNSGKLTSAVIPSSVKYINSEAFYGNDSLKTVKMSSGVTVIGNGAFGSCYEAEFSALPSTVKEIGDYAFSSAEKFNCAIPAGLKSLGEHAFENTAITTVKIPKAIKSIPAAAFSGCNSLKTVKLSSALTSIGDNAFANCNALTKVTFYKKVTSIGNSAFENCESLKTVTVSSTVKTIGESAFKNSGLTKFTMPKKLETIGDYAFAGTKLKSVKLGNVKTIGKMAFYNCENMTSVTIPKTVTEIGEKAFGYFRDFVVIYKVNIFGKKYIADSYFTDVKKSNFTVKCYKNTAGYKYAKDKFTISLLK